MYTVSKRAALTFMLLIFPFIIVALPSCAVQKVSPWERGNLAKKVMVRNSDSHHGGLEQHTYSSKEGTGGGYSVGGGGCGCN